MMNKQQILGVLIFILLILLPSTIAVKGDDIPCFAVQGIVTVDGETKAGSLVYVENLDTNESQEVTTYDGSNNEDYHGYYFAEFPERGDIKVTVIYDDIYFTNYTQLVFINKISWCNISIVTGETPHDPPPGGNGESPEEPEDPPEEPDEPDGNETEEPEQNETENGNETQYYLTIAVVDNATGDPISSVSVTVYRNNSKIAKSYTDDTGLASFLLEEGDYTVEVAKEGYTDKSGSFSLLCSVDQPFSLDKKDNGNPNSQPTEDQGVPLHIYGIICAIVVIIILGVIAYWRWYM